ncbi:MBL fold metallo-hydrolase [Nevskia soli]|jgi:phosphoribosyl 1,2-cyclic phosphodiesterase|uniref:MBL fold metallo-hydrolase n=1 Tax=Nevskia soli TaxID=418856 RepID=UPI0015D7ACB1|nr:MBL fold metallo-hydrolase [Nevskia soli]
MVKFCVLSSGSTGNAALLATSHTRILIDAGLSLRELSKRLASIGESCEQLDAILLTHEHSDHISGLLRLLRKRKFTIPVYSTRLTAPEIDWEEAEPRLQCFQAGMSFTIGDIAVQSFSIPHDARDPVGFCFRAGGVRIGLATDLGYIPDSLRFHLREVDLLLLESNHDIEMLKVGPYPWSVKQRVMGRRGHLSNDVVCDFLTSDLDPWTRTLILGHLSEHNNHPELVRMGAESVLARRSHPARLVVAEQSHPTEVFAF